MKAITAAAILFFIAGCSTPDGGWTLDPFQFFMNERANQRMAYINNHPEINEPIRGYILKGMVMRGMTPEQVLVCRGTPNRRASTHTENGYSNVWVYGTTTPVRRERPREYVETARYNGRYGHRRFRCEFKPTSAYYFQGGVLTKMEYY